MMFQLVLLMMISCNGDQEGNKKSNSSMKDRFYSESRYEDMIRVPLIKPYEIYSADDGFIWFLNFRYPDKIRDKDKLDGVDLIGVQDSIIIAFSNLTALPGEMTPAWFIVDVSKSDEKVFTKEKEYEDYLMSQNLNSIKLYNPKEVFEKFDKTGELPW